MDIRAVRVGRVIKEHAGGTQSRAAVAEVEGEKRFLKSRAPSQYGNVANFESEILAHDLFELVGVESPQAEVVRLMPGSPLRKELGEVVLSMEYVDSQFTGGDKVAEGGWMLPEGAVLDKYLKMTLVDILSGNSDRRGANYFQVWRTTGVEPIPIDNNSGFGNLLTQKYATNHCNFIKSYDGAGAEPGIRQNGKIANLFIDTTLHSTLLDEPHERERALQLAGELIETLTDQKIAEFVERLPREIFPDDFVLDFASIPPDLERTSIEILKNGSRAGLTGEELFAFRKTQIKETLVWRRDHLLEALRTYFAEATDPRKEPLDECSNDWNLLHR